MSRIPSSRFVLVLSALVAGAAWAQPANDACAGAESLTFTGTSALSASINPTGATYTAATEGTFSCLSAVNRTVWYSFVAPATAAYTIQTCSPTTTTNYDTIVALYTGSGCGALTQVTGACSDDGCSSQSTFTTTLTAGTTYWVQVAAWSSASAFTASSRVQLSVAYPPPAPANDSCSAAVPLSPSSTPGVTVSAPPVQVSNAAAAAEVVPACVASKNDIWYSFVAPTSGTYRVDTCGASNYDTVVALYTGACGSLVPVAGACNDTGGCTPSNAAAVIAALTAGTQYFVQLASASSATLGSVSSSGLNVTLFNLNPADQCSVNSPQLALNTVFDAVTASVDAGYLPAFDDSRTDGGVACYAGVGQTLSTAPGRDTAYQFRANEAGKYSFRLGTPTNAVNGLLYLADSCQPVSGGTSNYGAGVCRAASNRNTAAAEQISCVDLAANQTVFAFVDEHVLSTAGSTATLEVTRCTGETEPNATPLTANDLACVTTGSIGVAGDVDFYALGAHPPGSRVFAIAEGLAANLTDFDMRLTTEFNTLEYDDLNASSAFGDSSPLIAGAILNGLPAYLRVNYFSSTTAAEPYNLHAVVRYGAPVPETEPNDTFATATTTGTNYFTGAITDGGNDVDFYRFTANAGDLIFAALDPVADKTDAGVGTFNFGLTLVDGTGATIITSDDTSTTLTFGPTDAGLAGNTPTFPSEGILWRARTTGSYGVRVFKTSGANLNPYVLSITTGCQDLVPTITAANPLAGSPAGGETLTIDGTNFSTRSVVRVGTGIAQIVTVTPTQLVVRTPISNSSGTFPITVTNAPGMTASLTPGFTYDDPPGIPPTIVTVTPGRGPVTGGTVVTLAGSVFRPDASVFFDVAGTELPAAAVTVNNSARITATTPPHAEGLARVRVLNTDGLDYYLDGGFLFDGFPQVSRIDPNVGPSDGGQTITVEGRNFRTGATVRIGGTLATGVVVQDGGIALTAVTPSSAVNTPVDVIVRNTDGLDVQVDGGYTYFWPAPLISSIAPTFGIVDGGTSITITGNGFQPAPTVTIGGVPALSVTRNSLTSVTAVSPPVAQPGTAEVVLTNSDSKSVTLDGGFRYLGWPTIASISPDAGFTTGGELVTITGADFRAPTTVLFGTTAGTSVTVADGGASLTVLTPAVSPNGLVNVTVRNTDTNQAVTVANAYFYEWRAPTVAAVNPNSGFADGGTSITVTGTGFQPGITVAIGGVAATSVNRTSATSLTAVTQAGTPGLADVVVTNTDGKTGTLANGFRYVPPPLLASLTPSNGPVQGGTRITLTGQDFLQGATVTVGGVPAFAVNVTSPTTATAVTNAGAAGLVDVVLTNPDTQRSTLTGSYRYDGAPSIASISPITGTTAGGTVITISGTGFLAGARAFFGSTEAASLTVVSATELTATTAPTAAGVVAVRVQNTDGQADELPRAYRFVTPPAVTSIAPTTGDVAGGTAVRITGTGFTAGAEVRFGGAASTAVSFISATELEAVSPSRATPGAVDVEVEVNGASAALPNAFTYTRGAPTLTAVAPVSGPIAGGTLLTLSGSGFASGATVTVGGSPATDVVVVSEVLVRAVAPAHAAGAVDVVVTNDDAQAATLANAFTYVAPMTGEGGTVVDGGSGAIGQDPVVEPPVPGGVSCGCSSFDASSLSLAGFGLLMVLSRRRRRS